MVLRIAMLLVGVVTATESGQTQGTSHQPVVLQTVTNAWAVIRDLFNIFFGNVTSFRKLLAWASELVTAVFPPRPPPRVVERWWGDERLVPDSIIRPFRVHFSDEMISDLRERIRRRRNVSHSLDGAGHTYGITAEYLEQFVDQWANHYDFKEREDWLNSFPQYITNIQGLNIHYIHVKPANPHNKKVLPLLLLHGWPVTAFEYVHVIQQLQAERDDCDFVFEIIAPDHPGIGYSEATRKIGMSNYQIGIIMKNLMERVGKPRFYIHAGDMGKLVADNMAVLFPGRVLGLHSNFAFSLRPQTLVKLFLGQLYPPAVIEERYQDRMYPLADKMWFLLEASGYLHIQASKPDNVAHGTEDSPVAQISWILGTIITTSDRQTQLATDGNLSKKYDMRDWLDIFTVYWDSQCIHSGMRLYAEALGIFQDPLIATLMAIPSFVPFAAIRFGQELLYQPDDFLRDKYPNLVQSITLDYGGHFAAYEQPAQLVDSIWTAVSKMEQFHSNRFLGD